MGAYVEFYEDMVDAVSFGPLTKVLLAWQT